MAEVREIVVASAVDASADVLDWDLGGGRFCRTKGKKIRLMTINDDNNFSL